MRTLGSSEATVNDPKKHFGPDHGWQVPPLEPLDPLSLETRQTQMEQYQLYNQRQRRDGVQEQNIPIPGVTPTDTKKAKPKGSSNTLNNQPYWMADNESGDAGADASTGDAWPGRDGEDFLFDDPLANQPKPRSLTSELGTTGLNRTGNRGQVLEKDAHTGVMVAYMLPQDVAEKLAVVGGEQPEDMHVTIAYFGKDLESWQVDKIRSACARLTRQISPLPGELGGTGHFPASESSEGREVTVALVDVPRLEMLRQRLLDDLAGNGIEPLRNHGYTPHITLKYHDPGEGPGVQFQPIPITIGTLTVCRGDQHWDYPLNGSEVIKADDEGDHWVTIRGQRVLIGSDGQPKGGNPKLLGQLRDRALLAKSTYKPVTVEKTAIADKSEADIAKALGIPRTGNNKPFDLQCKKFGIEVKTFIDQTNSKVTMHGESLQRKLEAIKTFGLKGAYTVVADKRGGRTQYYVKQGLGSFRLNSLTPVTLSQLKAAIK